MSGEVARLEVSAPLLGQCCGCTEQECCSSGGLTRPIESHHGCSKYLKRQICAVDSDCDDTPQRRRCNVRSVGYRNDITLPDGPPVPTSFSQHRRSTCGAHYPFLNFAVLVLDVQVEMNVWKPKCEFGYGSRYRALHSRPIPLDTPSVMSRCLPGGDSQRNY